MQRLVNRGAQLARGLSIGVMLLAGTGSADPPDVTSMSGSSSDVAQPATPSTDAAPDAALPLPLGNFMRTAAPRRTALSLTEVLVPADQGVTYAFTRLTVDTPFYQWHSGRKPSIGARTRVPFVVQAVPSEDRATAGLGNLQVEGWFSWQSDRPSQARRTFAASSLDVRPRAIRRHHAVGVGFVFPLGLVVEAPVHSYFQAIDETVEALGPYVFYHFYGQGRRFDLEAEVSVGLGAQGGLSAFVFPIGTGISLAGYYRLSPKVALMAGGLANVYSGAVVAGLRLTPSDRLEVGIGVNIPTGEWYWELQPTVDPTLELRWRF